MSQDYTEHRQYIRLNSCFPVEFSLYFDQDNIQPQEYQAFTCNISEGGLCLDAKNLKPEDIELILNKKPHLDLTINIPLWGDPVRAKSEIVWVKKDTSAKGKERLLLGLLYIEIDDKDKKRILNYARRLKWIPKAASVLLLVFFIGFLTVSLLNIQSRRNNTQLINKLVHVSEIKTGLEKRLNELKVRKEMLENRFEEAKNSIHKLETEAAKLEKRSKTERERLEESLKAAETQRNDLKLKIAKISVEKEPMAYQVTESRLTKLNKNIDSLEIELSEVIKKGESEAASLHSQLEKLQAENRILINKIYEIDKGEVMLEEQLSKLRLDSGDIEQASIEKMLEWLKIHQTKRTGLVVSYEGDKNIKDWAFTYDQALVVQVFLISGEIDRASEVLDFYKNKATHSDNLFYNAYDVKTSLPCEYTIHSGPSIWLAISACQYTYKTGQQQYLSLAKNIAAQMMRLQKSSSDGSIKGGPDTNWVSTEHNLDAYALFNMLYELTKQEEYKEAASATLNWLKTVGYNEPEKRFMRGKGDATIATDTFSWAIAAIGPKTLLANGMDPDAIMEFAERECRVQTKFYRPEGRSVDITGFDFAKAANIGRGGVVSTEWTAQMIVAFEIMAQYYRDRDSEKSNIYKAKAGYYLSELGKMVISSPSPTGQGEGCLPYASIDDVDTGHGWRVAKGRRTGSVAGTAYYIFAYKRYDPLSF